MIETGIDVRVRIQDIVSSQLPEFILTESPLTDDFLKQFYISQEFQGGAMDFASNLDQYLELGNINKEAVYGEYELTEDLDETTDVVRVTNTRAFPNEWGLFKIDNEIFTYTGITTNSFTGVQRGFSGITSYSNVSNPGELVFDTSVAETHKKGAELENLSTLFLKEFYKKFKFTFAPGFEDLDFNSQVNTGNWIRQARSFYQTKGSVESIRILFRVLFGEEPTVIDLEQFLIKPSTAEYSRRDYAVVLPVEGNPADISGKTIYETGTDNQVFGAVSEIEPFTRVNDLYFRIYFFVSNDEVEKERKQFTVPGRTFAQREFIPGQTSSVTVDSTLGFDYDPNATLADEVNSFVTADGNVFLYETKTVNQFLGVVCKTDPNKTIGIGDEIVENILVYGYNDQGEIVTMRMLGVLSDLIFDDDRVPFSIEGEKIRAQNLGENIVSENATRDKLNFKQVLANSFIYNTSCRFQVDEVNGTNFSIKAPYLDKAFIKTGDMVDIVKRGTGEFVLRDREVTNVDFLNATITIDDTFGLPDDDDLAIDIRRQQTYATSTNSPIDFGQNNVLTNVLNLYDASLYDSTFYVATNSLPSYPIDVKIFDAEIVGFTTTNLEGFNEFENNYSTIVFDEEVDFITGDQITYRTTSTRNPGFCTLGEYFVEVLADRRKIKLYFSPSFIGSENYVPLEIRAGVDVGAHVFTLESQSKRVIVTQRSFHKIPLSETATENKVNVSIERPPTDTTPGTIAILTNGVEVSSYKSRDNVYLGPIESIDAVSGGEGYSVISPPRIIVTDDRVSNVLLTDTRAVPQVGINTLRALATPVIRGQLEKILIDPQDFDIDKVFDIKIVGGNNIDGAIARPQIERRKRSIPFDSRLTTFGGGVDPNDESILFLVDHKLPYGERVIYNNKGEESIGIASAFGSNASAGDRLANGGVYFVKPVNNRTIQLFETMDQLTGGANPVGLTSNFTGYGIQSFDTFAKNTLIGATIDAGADDFYYRNMKFGPKNIVVEYDELRYENHGFKTGDLVEYGVVGLGQTTVPSAPISGLSTTLKYKLVVPDENTIKFCNAGIAGTDLYDFERRDFVDLKDGGQGVHFIKYEDISVDVVVSYASTITGIITATPFVKGEIESVYVDRGGYYGSDIINFEKNPIINVRGGVGARIKPIVNFGEITGIQILSRGRFYQQNPELVVTSPTGAGALLRAIVEDGEISDVLILSAGLSYGENDTDIEVVDTGKGAILNPRIRALNVNLYTRFGFEGLVDNNYSIVAYDRDIRENVYGDFGFSHSPIIGWANDGNPIYGGFGLDVADDINSGFRAMRPSYVLDPSNIEGRPSLAKYEAGFFVDDFVYTGDGDLDEYNGRYCRTPEFPEGVYAYFAGISTDVNSLSKAPVFPYFIGDQFRDSPYEEALEVLDQDFDINDKPIFRNTFPYFVGQPFAGSEFLVQSYLFDTQDAIILDTQDGKVKNIDVVGLGQSYVVGDICNFDSSEDYLSAVVSEVHGPLVKDVQAKILSYGKDVVKILQQDKRTIRIYTPPAHGYRDNDEVIFSGLSTTLSNIAGPRQITVKKEQASLFAPLPGAPIGMVTDIFLNSIPESISIGCSIKIGENVGVGSTAESATVINIFPNNKALRIIRPDQYAPNKGIGCLIDIVPNYFEIDYEVRNFTFESDLNEQYYFNPRQTIGVGTETGSTHATTFGVGSLKKSLDIPVKQLYAPGHGFVTGEEIIIEKRPNDDRIACRDRLDSTGAVYLFPATGVNTSSLYVVKHSPDYIGFRTESKGQDLFFLTNGSNSPLYNIRPNRFYETGLVDRIQGEITTKTPHLLGDGDVVDVTLFAEGAAGVGSAPNIKVMFDEISQSLYVDPKVATGFNTESGRVNIPLHGFKLGDYLIYLNDGTAVSGLETHRKYFVVPYDRDQFQLAETLKDISLGSEVVIPIGISTGGIGVGTHTFAKVNPQLRIVENHDIEFDLSDPSLFGKEFNFYYDDEFTEIFDNNSIDRKFVVTGVSTEGYPDATKTILFSQNNPDLVHYNLEIAGYISTADKNARNNNSITYTSSQYVASAGITSLAPDKFVYSLQALPEKESYIHEVTGIVSYTTSSTNTRGGVADVRIVSSGKNFRTLPEFIDIDSDFGGNASLRAESDDIGRVASFRIQNPGWGYSADNTLRPEGSIQPKIEYSDSDFVTTIEIEYGGYGYQGAPNAVLIDSKTRKENTTGSIELTVQSSVISEVNIEVPPTGLSKRRHELYTVNNSNGIPISRVDQIDRQTGIVSYRLQTPILNYINPPFQTGDLCFVENIIPESGITTTNLNSADYGYEFFEIVNVSPTNPIIVSVQYPPETAQNIGVAITNQRSFSSIVNKKNYPIFTVNQETATLIEGERLSVFDEVGNLRETDLIVAETSTNYFKVTGAYQLLPGDVVKGNVSGVILTITNIQSGECRFQIEATSRINTGWNDEIGFIGEEFQCLPDNDYYQNLSYSIKSTVNFEDLIGPVNRLVHPAGLKNFSDTKIESSAEVGVASSESNFSFTLDLIGLTDVVDTPLRVDRINVFDLGYDAEVYENLSNAIRFNSKTPNKRLTDYIEAKTNRVLLCDDISDQFIDSDNIRDQEDYIDFFVVNSEYTRGLLQARNPFTDEVELTEVILLAYNNRAYTLQKAIVWDGNAEVGYGDFEGIALTTSEYVLRYTPYDNEKFDMDFKLFTNRFIYENQAKVDIGNIMLGGQDILCEVGTTTEIFRETASGTSANGVFLNVQIINEQARPFYVEVYAFICDGDTHIATYSFNADSSTGYSDDAPGTFTAVTRGGAIAIEYTNDGTGRHSLTTKSTEYNEVDNGGNPYRFRKKNIGNGEERSLILQSDVNSGLSNSSKIEVWRLNRTLFQSARSVVYFESPNFGAIHQVMTINSDGNTYVNEYPFITEGDGVPGPGIGTFGSELIGDDWILNFYPDADLLPLQTINLYTYSEIMYRDWDRINYTGEGLVYSESEEKYYLERYIAPLGERTNSVRFGLTYQGIPIYEKSFGPNEVITDQGPNNFNLFNIKEHFFSTGEELYYEPDTTVPGAPVSPIQVRIGGVVQDMPETVYAIKRDLNRFSVGLTSALAFQAEAMELVGFGTGNNHRIGMKKKLEKGLFTINGVVQSPIATSNKVYETTDAIDYEQNLIPLAGIGTIRVGDLLLIEEEYVRIDNVGFSTSVDGPINNTGSVPLIDATRGVVGSAATDHLTGIGATLFRGSYNIVESDIIFTEAPSGKGPVSINESNLVETNADFQGRVFLQKQYNQIAVFDDFSDEFNGITNTFEITKIGEDVQRIENGSGILIINDIYQTPTTENNEGNNYFYTSDLVAGVSSVTFTGVTSTNGQRVESEFDINQNQIPRGGLIVSLGSTPGLGYAPRYGASIEAEVVNGEIVGIITTNTIGVTTDVKYADYNKETGELVVTAYGAPATAALGISSATYVENTGSLVITTPNSLTGLGIEEDDIIVLKDMRFDCGGYSSTPVNIVDAPYNEATGELKITTAAAHGLEINDYVELEGLEYTCTGSTRVLNVTGVVYDDSIGVATVTLDANHGLIIGDSVALNDLEFACNGSSLSTSIVSNAIYDAPTGVVTVTTSTPHGASSGSTVTLEGLEFSCPGESFSTSLVTNAIYDETTGIATVFVDSAHGRNPGDTIRLTGLGFTCTGVSGITTTIFPDGTYGYDFQVIGAATTSLSVNVGASTIPHTYVSGGLMYVGLTTTTFPDGTFGYDFEVISSDTNTLSVNVGASTIPHTYVSGGTVVSGITTTIFPDGTYGNQFTVLGVTTSNEFTIFTGGPTPTITHTYVSGGTATVGFTTTLFPDGTFGYDFQVLDVTNSTEFVVNVGTSTITHTYATGGTATVGLTTDIFPDKDNTFAIVSIVDDNRFSVDVGVSSIPHAYVSGGTWQKFNPFNFGREGDRPQFVYLDGMEFTCPGNSNNRWVDPFQRLISVGFTTTIFPDTTDHFPLVFRDDGAHWRILVGTVGFDHIYVGGGTIGQYTINSVGSGYNDVINVGFDDDNHTGTDAVVEGRPTAGGELEFVVVNPGTGYTDGVYAWCPDPNFYNLPVKTIFRRGAIPEALADAPDQDAWQEQYGGKNLFVSCEVGAANTTAIGRSEFFEVKNFELSNQGFSYAPGDIIEVVGLVTAKGLPEPKEYFQLSVLETFSDNVSVWNFGQLDYIDSIKSLQDGSRTRFPLIYKGETFSFELDPNDESSAAIDLDSILLIYVNTVLQVPKLNYVFDGGTSFEFTAAPFAEDDIDIYFYRGKRGIDSNIVTEIDESIRPGDELQIKKNDYTILTDPDPRSKTQRMRTVTEIASSDTVRTDIYFGNRDIDEVRPRQVAWDKQKRDIFIYGDPAPKTRDSYEPIIQPRCAIIRDFSTTDSEMFVDSARYFEYEAFPQFYPGLPVPVLASLQGRAYKSTLDEFVVAEFEAVVNNAGEVQSINIINAGKGYPSDAALSISSPVDGVRATATPIMNTLDGSFIAVIVNDRGSGYDQANPPSVITAEPSLVYEDFPFSNVEGFAGIITGIRATGGIGPVTKGIEFRYIVEEGIVPADLKVGYSVVVNNSVVGNGVESISNSAVNVVGVGTQFLDCAYEVMGVTVLGRTGSFQVNVNSSTNLSGIDIDGDNLGQFSWGRISGITRDVDFAVNFNNIDGRTFTTEMENYPTFVRTGEGLRNEGGLGKRV